MSWLQDVRYAARSLRKSPGFTFVAAITLALGVGANAAIFSVVNTVMLRPLPFANPDGLVRIWESNVERGWPTFATSHPNFLDFRAQATSVQSMAATTNAGFTLTPANGDAEVIQGMNVTATFLPTLRITPALGRNFTAEEDRPGGNRQVVVMSDGLWKRAFGSDPGVIGRTINLNAQPYTVIGVLPSTFQWGTNNDLLSPLAPDPARSRGDHRLSVIGRLADGSSIEQATTELETIASRLAQQYPESNKGWSVRVLSFYDWLIPDTTRRSLLVLLGAVGLVLLIACGNVVNLLLARGASRQKELSIRAAMGASRSRVARQLLFESALIALLAAALGIGLAFAAMQLLIALGPASVPRLDELSIDLRVVLFAIGVALSTMVLFGLVPAIQSTRHDPQQALHADSRGATSGAGRRRLRSALTIAEVALSVALLIGAGLLIRSFAQLQQVAPGFSTSGLMTARVGLPATAYPTALSRRAFFDRLLTDLRGRPGIEAAAIASGPPLSGDFTAGDVKLPSKPNEEAASTAWRLAGPGYFAALGIPLRGREFTMQDSADSPPVAIISAAIAQKYFPNEDPIGRAIIMRSFGEEPHTIVGVAGDVKTFGLDAGCRLGVLRIRNAYAGWNPMSLVWRSRRGVHRHGPRLAALDRSQRAALGHQLDGFAVRGFLRPAPIQPVSADGIRGRGAGAGGNRPVRRDGVPGVAAHARDRRPPRARRDARRCVPPDPRQRLVARGGRRRDRRRRRLLADAVMETLLFSVSRTDPVTFVAVPLTLDRCRRTGLLPAGETSDAGRSRRRAAD